MKTDARVRYTKMRIRESMLALLRQKPVSRITVKEICEGAEINRATFYTHYQDAFDLLEKLQDDYVDDLMRNMGGGSSRMERVISLFRYTRENKELVLLLGRSDGNTMWPRLLSVCNAQFQSALEQALPALPTDSRETIYRYLLGGSTALMSAWLRGEMDATPEELAKQIFKFSTAVIKSL